MVSVTQRIKQINQPRGGYINPKEFTSTQLEDNIQLSENENIHASLIGITVDYLTRFMLGNPRTDAFSISLRGAGLINEEKLAQDLLSNINGLDQCSITSACKLSGFDVVFRAVPMGYKPVEMITPDEETINNIKSLVERSLNFFDKYGPIVKDGFTLEGGYTSIITTGDGDFLTEDTLWDFKVSKKGPTNQHTLQLLIYYLMGMHSVHEEFSKIKYLGVYNPKLNQVYRLEIKRISENIIEEVQRKVIGY